MNRYFERAGARLPRGLFDRLARIAKERDRTVNYLVLAAIYAYLERAHTNENEHTHTKEPHHAQPSPYASRN